MTAARTPAELSIDEFAEIAAREFSFLIEELGFEEPLVWEFAGTLCASFERGDARVETSCGEREAYVWTTIECLDLGKLLGLDSLAALRGDGEYPSSMDDNWTRGAPRRRLALEAKILRRHLPAALGDRSLFAQHGGEIRPEAVSLDDPVETFPRRCSERFGWLERECGLRRELDWMGSAVLYRGDPVSVRISLLETSYEHEDEGHPTLMAEFLDSPGGVVPPLFEAEESFEPEREGPFSVEYLERAFGEVEHELRTVLESRRRNDG